MTPIVARGRGVTMELAGTSLTIRRSSIAPGGRSEKVIPLSSVTAVQYRSATTWTLGRMEFTVSGSDDLGALEFGRRNWDTLHHENAVIFSKKNDPDFRRIRDAIAEYQSQRA